MLALALVLAYTSSVCAALMSMAAGYAIIPALSIQSAAEGLNHLPELLFNLEITPVMSVMSALVFSVLGYFFVKNKNDDSVVVKLIPHKKDKDKDYLADQTD